MTLCKILEEQLDIYQDFAGPVAYPCFTSFHLPGRGAVSCREVSPVSPRESNRPHASIWGDRS